MHNCIIDEEKSPYPDKDNASPETLLVGRAYVWNDPLTPEDKSHLHFKIVVGPEAEHSAFRSQLFQAYHDNISDLVLTSDYLFSYDVTLFLNREKY